jgi:hypothetical protein
MKHLLLACLALLVGCQRLEVGPSKNAVPRLGQKISLPSHSELLAISSAQMSPYTSLVVGEISYKMAVNEADEIIYIETWSDAFRTPEGLGPNSTLEQVLASGGHPVVYENGWAHFSVLPSGWCAAFFGSAWRGEGIDLFAAPVSTTKVRFFFKRR